MTSEDGKTTNKNMKRIVLITLAMASLMAYAQYQLPNPGFEQWDGGSTSEPTHWNSFATSDGSFSGLASSPHHYRRNGGRPGTSGSQYLTIYTMSVFGIKANGNMTTGRIHAGSMSASSSDNYNYTQRSNAAHCQPFTGTPDSMYVWVSFYAASGNSEAQISAILHGDNDFRAPNQESSPSLYCAKAVARFAHTTTSAGTMQWQQMKVPFVYDGNAEAAYMLVNLTTNAIPGQGDGNDSLSVDDIEFVYSSWLNGIGVNGVPVEDFSKGTMDYAVHVGDTAMLTAAEVTCTTEVADATVDMERHRVDDTTALVTIAVTAEDGVSIHTYHVTLCASLTPEPVGIEACQERRFQVYPNPTTGVVVVEAEGNVSLHTMDGRLVESRFAAGSTTFDLTPLPAGMYLLRHGPTIHRLIKK